MKVACLAFIHIVAVSLLTNIYLYNIFSGKTPDGFKLKMVHLFFRHGDRMPFSSFVSKTNTPESCFVNTSLFGNDDILQRYVTTMTSFTGKQPTGSSFKWAIFPNQTKCSSGGLTGIGAAQLVRLGQYFRHKYLTLSRMFSNEIPLTSQIYAGSSKWTRTYQSLTAFLFGLLEQSDFNLTKLKIAHSGHYDLCFNEGSYKKECKFFQARNLSFQINRLRKEHRRNLADTSFVTHRTFNNLIETIGFTYCHNRSKICLPKNSTICFTSNDFNKIWVNFDRENRYVHDNLPDIKYFYTVFYPVMTQIVDQMNNLINQDDQTKLVVYSNHDSTLFLFLKVFGIDGYWIRYAGRIVLELFEYNIDNTPGKNNNKHKHYIKFLYDGKDLTESVTFCRGRTFRGLCEFSLLYDFVYKEMQQKIMKTVQ